MSPKSDPHFVVSYDKVITFKIAIKIRNEPSEKSNVNGLGLINKKDANGSETEIIIKPIIKKNVNFPHSITFCLTTSLISFRANSVSSSP